jgi:hypothetical protein
MDQIALVDRRIDDGQRLVQQLLRDNFDVTVAFWLKTSEEDWWHLYVASKVVDERGPLEAYRALQASLQQLPGTTVSLTDVKVIGTSSPITRDVLKIQNRYSGPAPVRFGGGTHFGGITVEETLIYPPPPLIQDSVPSKV